MSFLTSNQGYHPIKLTAQYKSNDFRDSSTILLQLPATTHHTCCCYAPRKICLNPPILPFGDLISGPEATPERLPSFLQKRFEQLYSGGLTTWNARTVALTVSFYTMVCAALVASLYCCLLYQLSFVHKDLAELYYGVQISYAAVLCSQLTFFGLGTLLYTAVVQERTSWVGLWMVGVVALTPLEGICTVYSNVLRDHVNKKFDVLSKMELALFLMRLLANILAVSGVFRFYRNLQSGVSYRPSDQISL